MKYLVSYEVPSKNQKHFIGGKIFTAKTDLNMEKRLCILAEISETDFSNLIEALEYGLPGATHKTTYEERQSAINILKNLTTTK